MSRFSLIATSCEISRDPVQNNRNHQALVDAINAEIGADGWAGVTITRLETVSGASFITVEPGPDALTLDLLRQVKAEMRLKRPPGNRDGQLSLAVA